MKKLISLLLAMIMVLSCVPMASAAAPKFVAANMDELSGLHKKPTAPDYTLETVDGKHVLTINAADHGKNYSIFADSHDDSYNWSSVFFTWDDEKKVFVSDDVLDTEQYPEDPTLYFGTWDGITNTDIKFDLNSGEAIYFCVIGDDADGNYLDCTWNDQFGLFSIYTSNGNVTYDNEDGSLRHYSVFDDKYDIYYDAYGRITGVSSYITLSNGETTWADWDFDLEAWTQWDPATQMPIPVETDEADFDSSKYPAPVALPYEIKLAPSTIDVNNKNAWELQDEDGNVTGYGMSGKNCYCYYDLEGNMTSYQYSDFDNETGVRYSVDGKLLRYWGTAADGTAYNYTDPSLAITLDDGTVLSGWYTWDEEGNVVFCEQPADLELLPMLIKPVVAKDRIWYPNNTMCVAGISLKDTYGITDKWYNVVPVDLTKDGTYTFDLVASGMYLIGKANVTVAEGNVTVTYGMPWGHGYIKEEVLNWFTSVDQITAEFCEAPTGAYAFGEPVSISEDLGGAEVGLLFICNRVTYRDPYFNNGAHLTRWYSNKPEWKAYREQLMTLMPE